MPALPVIAAPSVRFAHGKIPLQQLAGLRWWDSAPLAIPDVYTGMMARRFESMTTTSFSKKSPHLQGSTASDSNTGGRVNRSRIIDRGEDYNYNRLSTNSLERVAEPAVIGFVGDVNSEAYSSFLALIFQTRSFH